MGKPPIWLLIRAHVQTDPKKTAVLVILAVVMGLVYMRLFLKSGGPEEAAAGITPIVAPVMDAGTPTKTGQAREGISRISIGQPLERQLSRDPFLLGGDSNQVSTSNGDGTGQKAGTRPAQSEPLVLQSTLCGELPMATISGFVVRPGDEIRGYVVERIEPTQVVLRQGSLRAVLSLK